MANSLYPACVVVNYHSAYGFHKMTLPIRNIENPAGGPAYEVLDWGDNTRMLDDMINDLIDALLPRFPDTVEFDTYTPFTFATPTSDGVPLQTLTFTGQVGSAAVPGWSKATMETMTFRDEEAALAKLVLLDFASGNNFEKYTNAATAGVTTIVSVFTDASNAFSSRNGARPQSFIARTAKLNDELRKSYRMA